MHKFTLSLGAAALALALSSCVSVNEYGDRPASASRDHCLDATRQMRDFEVVSDREVLVDYGAREYRVVLKNTCPDLRDADYIGFATGPDRYVGRTRQGPIYASPVDGASRICGRANERLTVRDTLDDFSRPRMGCAIESVQRLP